MTLTHTYFYRLNRLLLLQVLLLIPACLSAQNALMDSLYQQLELATNDSTKAAIRGKLAKRLIRTNPDSAIVFANLNIAYGEKRGDLSFKGQSIVDKARASVRIGKYEEALSLNQEARKIFELLPDSLLLSMAYQGIGISYRHLGRFDESMNAQMTVVQILENLPGSTQPLARAYNNIAAVHGEIGEHRKAIEYFRKSLNIWKGEGNPESMAICHINIGGQAVSIDDFELAEESLARGLQIFDSLGLAYGIGASAANLGNLYMRNKDYLKARAQFQIALDQYTKLNDEGRKAMFLSDIGLAEASLKNYASAIDHQERALKIARDINRLTAIRDALERLAEIYAESGNFEKAFLAQKEYYQMADSIFNENTAAQIHELEAKYEAATKDKEIELLKKDQELQERENLGLLGGLISFFLLSAISIYAFISSRRTNTQLQIAQNRGQELLQEKEALIDQLKQTQIQLIQQEKMASLGQLSAGIAHEINNPVNFVRGNAEALSMDLNEIKPILDKVAKLKEQEKAPELLGEILSLNKELDTKYLLEEILELSESIKRGSSRIQNIVGSLKSFSHSSGEHFQETQLTEIIEATLTILTNKLKLKEAELEKEYKELPTILCQAGKINQVVMNILDNAIDAIPKGGKIRISSWQDDTDVFLKISDNGKGIDEKLRNKIFDPFFTTKEIGEGTGLGLSISFGIVKDHGGSIELQSDEAYATQFLVRLPIDGKSAPG